MTQRRTNTSLTFRLSEPDLCCKCGKDIPAGTHVSWLRDPGRKGYFHPDCVQLPTQRELTMVRVEDSEAKAGFRYVRVRDQRQKAVPPVAPALAKPDKDGVLGALVAAMEPHINARIAEALAKHKPGIVVNVFVPKSGDEAEALALLGQELFALQSVRTLTNVKVQSL